MAANTSLMTSPHISSPMASPINSTILTLPNKTMSRNARTDISLKPPETTPSSLSFTFWLEATSTVTYLINRLPAKTLNMQSPTKNSTKILILPPPQNLRMSLLPLDRLHPHPPLEPKSSPSIFLGYANPQSIRCFDPCSSKLIISRHVRFHEHKFPIATPNSIPPSPQISTIHNTLPPLIPTFYLPPANPQPTNPPPTNHPRIPPLHQSNTHIKYERRQPTTIHTSYVSQLPTNHSHPFPPPIPHHIRPH